MIIEVETSENRIQPKPRPLRESLINLKPMTHKATVMAASTSDMAIIANQYKISNNVGIKELVSSKVTPLIYEQFAFENTIRKKGIFCKEGASPQKRGAGFGQSSKKTSPALSMYSI